MKNRLKRGLGILLSIVLISQCGGYVQATDVQQPTEQMTPEQQKEAEIQASYNKTVESNAIPNWPQGPQVYGDSAIVMDMKTGAILYAKGIDEQRYPASITKILTALVAIENSKPTDIVKFSQESIQSLEPGYAHIAMKAGEEITMKDALHALMLASANEVAYAIGETVGGTHENFVKMMNDRAKELGCTHTHFINTNGMFDEQHYTSARDMALIADAAFSNPTLCKIASTVNYDFPATASVPSVRKLTMGHKMVNPANSEYYSGIVGGKTGYTSLAGQTLVTYAVKDDRRQVAVTLKSTQKTHYSDTKTILDFCFAKFKNVNIADNETEYVTGSAPVTIGAETYNPSELSIDSGAVITIPNDAQFTDANKTLETDLPEGHPQEAVARLVYTYNERRVGDAWIYSSSAQAVNATPSEPGGDTPPESRPAEDGQEGNTGFTLPRAVLIGGGAVLVLALLAGGGVFWFKRRQAAERERQRILREKRRQRLADIGYTEEDFERLLDERRKQHDMR